MSGQDRTIHNAGTGLEIVPNWNPFFGMLVQNTMMILNILLFGNLFDFIKNGFNY